MYKLPLYYLLAYYRRKRNYWPGVAANYRKILEQRPNDMQLRLRYIKALYKSKQYKKALREIDSAQKDNKNDELAVYKIRILTLLDPSRAVESAERASARGVRSGIFYKVYADALLQSGSEELARKLYLTALDNSDDTAKYIGEIYYRLATLSDGGSATEYYEKALSATTDVQMKSLGIGGLHQKYGDNESAIRELLKKAENEPDNDMIWFEIGKTYSRLRKMTEARHAYSEFMRINREKMGKNHSIDTKMVVFEAYRGRSYACSPRAIYEYMRDNPNYKDYRFVWVFRGTSIRKHWRLYIHPRTQVVKYKSKEYFEAYGRAKYWVTNARLNFIKKTSEDQIYVQCWHGSPLKKLGHSIDAESTSADVNNSDEEAWYDNDTRQFTYLLAQSQKAGEYFTEAFALNQLDKKSALLVSGYPRNDILKTYQDKQVKKIKDRLKIPSNKKVLLYAPTWRDDEYDPNRGYIQSGGMDFDELSKQLSGEWVVLFRPHYLIAKGFDFDKHKGFVYDASEVDDINELYIISDTLVTDYSSVFFDYANLGRPIIFYMYDLEHYMNDLRGFYMNLEKLPGEIVRSTDEIIDRMNNLDQYNENNQQKYDAFISQYVNHDDGHASQRVVERIIDSKTDE